MKKRKYLFLSLIVGAPFNLVAIKRSIGMLGYRRNAEVEQQYYAERANMFLSQVVQDLHDTAHRLSDLNKKQTLDVLGLLDLLECSDMSVRALFAQGAYEKTLKDVAAMATELTNEMRELGDLTLPLDSAQVFFAGTLSGHPMSDNFKDLSYWDAIKDSIDQVSESQDDRAAEIQRFQTVFATLKMAVAPNQSLPASNAMEQQQK